MGSGMSHADMNQAVPRRETDPRFRNRKPGNPVRTSGKNAQDAGANQPSDVFEPASETPESGSLLSDMSSALTERMATWRNQRGHQDEEQPSSQLDLHG